MNRLLRKQSRFLCYLSAFAFLSFLSGTSTAVFSAEKQTSNSLEKIRVAYSSISGNTASLWVAYEHGFFRKYGLNVELVFIEGGSTTVQTLISGDVALAQMAGSGVIQSHLRGADVVLIAGLINTLTFQVIVEKGISQPDHLKGKSVGVTRFGSSTDFAARYALDKWGLTPQKEVALMELGSMPSLLSALTSGKIQGAMLSAPFTLHAKKSGFPALADLQMLGLEYQHTGVAATQTLIKSKPDLMRNFMKAYVEGIHFYKTHRQEALAVMAKYLKTNDMEALTETYETIGLTLLPEKPYPTLKGIQLMLGELSSKEPKARSARPEQFVDTTFVRELDTSGFIDRLYKSSVSVARREQARPPTPFKTELTAPVEDKKSLVSKSVAVPQGKALETPIKPTQSSSAKADVAQEYTIQAGDTLSKLSERFYQSQVKWTIIYEANRETIKNPHYIYIGQQIRIPSNGNQGT
ncbi:MAG TPA: ABC transporter substrate-binding protein [Candidatus Binatia bacterium]|nr:ABC transporter substrate-binding protein [Candidatus Binatia bacterium]